MSKGRIRDGMARLDQAFTMIIGGECRDPCVISQVVCGMISACDRCGDVKRTEAWLRCGCAARLEEAACPRLRPTMCATTG